ncbi:MAG TPA: hypothetical protein VMT86_14395 [Bryobacteraceae bacterium]|nr:hypothetical protein [Bryobacteraceae bacterium]
MRKGLLLGTILSGLIVTALQPTPMTAATPALTGSWQFTLTPVSSSTPVQMPGLATFTTDGSVIETDGTEFVPSPAATTPLSVGSSPGHGIWEIAPVPGTFYVQYFSLVFESTGALYARNITTMMVTPNGTGNQFTGTYTTDQVIGNITKVLSSGSVTGQLIPHQPLP